MAKAQKVQYPNPKFFKAKDEINWKKQGENLKEVMGIFGDMLKKTDWKEFGQGWAEILKADGERFFQCVYDVFCIPQNHQITEIDGVIDSVTA